MLHKWSESSSVSCKCFAAVLQVICDVPSAAPTVQLLDYRQRLSVIPRDSGPACMHACLAAAASSSTCSREQIRSTMSKNELIAPHLSLSSVLHRLPSLAVNWSQSRASKVEIHNRAQSQVTDIVLRVEQQACHSIKPFMHTRFHSSVKLLPSSGHGHPATRFESSVMAEG